MVSWTAVWQGCGYGLLGITIFAACAAYYAAAKASAKHSSYSLFAMISIAVIFAIGISGFICLIAPGEARRQNQIDYPGDPIKSEKSLKKQDVQDEMYFSALGIFLSVLGSFGVISGWEIRAKEADHGPLH